MPSARDRKPSLAATSPQALAVGVCLLALGALPMPSVASEQLWPDPQWPEEGAVPISDRAPDQEEISDWRWPDWEKAAGRWYVGAHLYAVGFDEGADPSEEAVRDFCVAETMDFSALLQEGGELVHDCVDTDMADDNGVGVHVGYSFGYRWALELGAFSLLEERREYGPSIMSFQGGSASASTNRLWEVEHDLSLALSVLFRWRLANAWSAVARAGVHDWTLTVREGNVTEPYAVPNTRLIVQRPGGISEIDIGGQDLFFGFGIEYYDALLLPELLFSTGIEHYRMAGSNAGTEVDLAVYALSFGINWRF